MKSFPIAPLFVIASILPLALVATACCGGGSSEPVKVNIPSPSGGDDDACPASFNSVKDKDGKTKCNCSASATGKGSVWGTEIYTADSSICKAAVHAGVIKKKGGEVSIKGTDGCDSYVGSKDNGISSSKWGKFKQSFYFTKNGKAKCAGAGKSAKNAKDACPDRFNKIDGFDNKGGDKNKISCECAADQTNKGSLYGEGVYTTDSSICKAARHAGVIDDKGGKVKAKGFEGCKAYKGSAKNGVSSSKWGSYQASFYFPKAGDPKCE